MVLLYRSHCPLDPRVATAFSTYFILHVLQNMLNVDGVNAVLLSLMIRVGVSNICITSSRALIICRVFWELTVLMIMNLVNISTITSRYRFFFEHV